MSAFGSIATVTHTAACSAGSSDIEKRSETACRRLGMALYLSFEEEGLRHIWETKYV
jgi:hypothetical protein